MTQSEREKELAGKAGADLVRDGDVVGLGTGSTAFYMMKALGERVNGGLKVRGIPTSSGTADIARSVGIPLIMMDEVQEIDITIDGADEFDGDLNLIKGGGGALLREKIVASASMRYVIITDSSKQVKKLGKFPLPVEVVGFARVVVTRKIEALGASVTLRKGKQGDIFVTDEGHQILDCSFGEIADPKALARAISDMPGVMEHGLFVGMAQSILVGKGESVVEIRR